MRTCNFGEGTHWAPVNRAGLPGPASNPTSYPVSGRSEHSTGCMTPPSSAEGPKSGVFWPDVSAVGGAYHRRSMRPASVSTPVTSPGFDRDAFERLRLPRRMGEAISGLDDAPMVDGRAATHMRDDDYVIGFTRARVARAYPLWVIDNYHVV